jgi:phosphoglycerol transferase MdoB-like AlkP superfamily enzyme
MGRIDDWLRDIKKILDITLFNKWLWIIIGAMGTIAIVPFLIMFVALSSPSWVSATILILVIIGWGVAGGYKEWLLHKQKEEKTNVLGQEAIPFNYDKHSLLEEKKKEEDD